MGKIQFLFVFLLVCISSTLFSQEKERYIRAGTFYDSAQKLLLKNKVIHVIGNEIQEIGNEEIIPKNAEIINLRNYTVLPGLIDAHTHVLFDQAPNTDFTEHSICTLTTESDALRALRGAKRAKSYLDVGITSIKDLGNSGLFLDVALRNAINEGSIEGPRIFASGPILSSAGGQLYGVSHQHQNIIGLEYRVIKSEDDARNAVRELLNQNVDLIKICADNLPNNSRLTLAEMKAIVETAHSYGLTVTAHSVSNQSAWEAAQAGVDGIEHGFNLADSTLALMAKKKIFLVPTENSRTYMETYFELAGYSKDELGFIDIYLVRNKSRLVQAIEKGVVIVAGSDNYSDIKVPRGTSSRDMFRAYYEAGMKPMDILQSATYISALKLNKEKEIGILNAGNKADIIAVKGNLKTDFLNTLDNVVFVMKDGVIYRNIVTSNQK